MSAPIIQFSEALKAAIQAGETITEGNVIRVIADNGREIGNAALKVIQGGNGVATEAYAATGAVAGGAATTSGVAILAVDVGLAGAAIAPALGILAGVGLYNLAPSFWDGVADVLMQAGETIHGKVVAYFDGDNIMFDEETIEIFKNALLTAGAFEPTGYTPTPEQQEFITYPILNYPVWSMEVGHSFESAVSYQRIADQGTQWERVIPHKIWVTSNEKCLMSLANNLNSPQEPTALRVLVTSSHPFTYHHWWYDPLLEPYQNDFTADSAVIGGETIYAAPAGEAIPADMGNDQFFNHYIEHGEWSGGAIWRQQVGYINFFGTYHENDMIQPDAVLPDSDPFPLTYPDWYPFSYPQTAPADMPTIYPVKYPNTEPDPLPTQQPAQNPLPESVPATYPEIIPDLPLPLNVPTPTPQPEPIPDPDPQPDPDPIPEPDTGTPQPDPIDPNPDPDGTGVVGGTLPETVGSNKLFTVYNPTASELDSLGAYLWDASLIDTLKKIWQNPLDGIISLIQVYVTPSTTTSEHIILGYLDSNVSAAVVDDQFVEIDCGTISIEEDKQNATDYAPYTSLHVYLPFIGMVELNVNEFMNGDMTITYRVDVYTGTCIATISCERTPDMDGAILYEYSGNCSQQIPLTSGNASGVLQTLLSAAGVAMTVASGGSLGVVAGATMVGNSLTHEMFHVSHSGNLSANAGILGNRKPFAVLSRRHCYDANDYSVIYGYPANKTIYLGNHAGNFVRVKAGFLKTSATNPEHDEIMALLKQGVIL